MTIEFLSILILALSLNELIHNAFEVWGARQKVQWLTARIDHQSHGDWPIKIDTWVKTIMVHAVLLIILVGGFVITFSLLRLKAETMLLVSIGVMLLSYAYTVYDFDRFHHDIGKLLRRYKRQ